MALVLKRILLILGLWLVLSAATIRCSSGTFQDEDDNKKPDRNRAPVASNSFLQTSLNQAVADRMQATDPDGDPLTFRVTAGPDRGSLTRLDDRGFFTYLPAELGSDQFSFRANDGQLDSNTAQVTIRVTLTAAAAAGRAKPGRPTGLAGVYADGADPAALLVLWSGSDGSLDRVPPAGAGPIETRLAEVAAVAVDPWQSGRLVALQTDGTLAESRDAGASWSTRGRLAAPVAGAEVALSPARIVVARPGHDCDVDVPRVAPTGVPETTEVCGSAPFIGPDGDAYVLTGDPGQAELRSLGSTPPEPVAAIPPTTKLAGSHADARPSPAASATGTNGSSPAESTLPVRVLASAVIRAGADPLRPGRLWALDAAANGDRLRVSVDGGNRWHEPAPLPAGRAVDASNDADGRLWLVTVVGERATRVHRLDGRTWTAVAEVAAAGGRLHRCGPDICLLGPAGERLWRLPMVAGSAAPPAE